MVATRLCIMVFVLGGQDVGLGFVCLARCKSGLRYGKGVRKNHSRKKPPVLVLDGILCIIMCQGILLLYEQQLRLAQY